MSLREEGLALLMLASLISDEGTVDVASCHTTSLSMPSSVFFVLVLTFPRIVLGVVQILHPCQVSFLYPVILFDFQCYPPGAVQILQPRQMSRLRHVTLFLSLCCPATSATSAKALCQSDFHVSPVGELWLKTTGPLSVRDALSGATWHVVQVFQPRNTNMQSNVS